MITIIKTIDSVKDQLLLLSDKVLDGEIDNGKLFRELCRLAGRLDFVVESLNAINEDIIIKDSDNINLNLK